MFEKIYMSPFVKLSAIHGIFFLLTTNFAAIGSCYLNLYMKNTLKIYTSGDLPVSLNLALSLSVSLVLSANIIDPLKARRIYICSTRFEEGQNDCS